MPSPAPKPEDLIASVAGGKKFTILDLTHAYQQQHMPINNNNTCLSTTTHAYQQQHMPINNNTCLSTTTHAYQQQMLLQDELQQYPTVNTHKGLYKYLRLPFGVAPAQVIVQRAMDTMLQGISHVECYLDDILITGEDDQEH